MSTFTSLIRRAPKRFSAVVAMIAAAVIIPTAVMAWGPDRDTYTWANPADHVVFNSITDNPVQGDERNFMQVREATAGADTYADTISLQADHEYVVNMYYHNNASSTLNDAAHGYAGIAHGAFIRAEIPGLVPSGSNGTVAEGYVGATNANPLQVWDEVSFKNSTANDIALKYVAGSATIHNFGAINGQTLPDTIVTSGAALGYDSQNGELPGCNEYSGYVTFTVKAVVSSYTIDKQVRIAGQTEYSDSVNAQPGDTLEYRIQYKNTGSISHKNVVIKDELPAHVSYIAGSTTLKNSNNPNGKSVDDGVTTTGINIGDYAPGSNAYVKFSAKVAAVSELACGTNTLTNTASAQVGQGTKEDTATAKVDKTCQPGQITVCEIATNNIVTIDEGDFDKKKYSKDLNDCELPHTGMTENIVAIVGVGALIASIVYYVASRRALNQ